MTNRLKFETSPYLLQHAKNPVNWQPWDKKSLKQARDTGKPILLSIGYAACHWCHVMEKESFENPQIAEVMNERFICIKVDREERPDLDKIYQLSHQILTQRSGGWPLTLALTPEGQAPYFAGTYFPPEPKHNLPGFGDLLIKISNHYQENKDKLNDYHSSFNSALEKLNPVSDNSNIPDADAALRDAIETLKKQFDTTFGGFGDAPKFPHPTQLELLQLGSVSSDSEFSKECQSMLELTLSNMLDGGMFDHLGGGFFRYSVDRQWQIPHFEKMLYDNAQLLNNYCDAYCLLKNPRYADAIRQTADWVIKEMQFDSGGYYSTIDADSEGEEGKFYVWSDTDLRAVLSESEHAIIENYFGLYGEENFEGRWHFNVNPETDHSLLNQNNGIKKELENAKKLLFDLREERVKPALDDKILASWNGLMIQGMSRSGRVLEDPKLIDSAQHAVDFIRNNMWQGNRLLATCSAGKAKLNGYLDDYAFMLVGLLEVLESNWRGLDLEFAISIANTMLDRFEDVEHGGFYFTSHDHESLLYRSKTGADDAIPAGNAYAIQGLLKLGTLIGEPRYLNSAEKALSIFATELVSQPSVNASMVAALQSTKKEHASIIIRGKNPEISQWAKHCYSGYNPNLNVYAIDKSQKFLPPGLSIRKPSDSTIAYICSGTQCLAPIQSLEALKSALGVI
jgi:uncharacterized protein YyaL (SSP411 family)